MPQWLGRNPGDIIKDFCAGCCTTSWHDEIGETISGTTNQILGQDDEWYCEVCDKTYYHNIKQYYHGDTTNRV